MAATDYMMGTLFAAVVAFLIYLSFSRGLSPFIVGAGILVTLVLWYMVNGADVDPPPSSTSANNTTASSPSPGGGPDLDGPDLNNTTNNSGSGGGGGSGGNGPVVHDFEIKTRNNQPLEEGIKPSDIFFQWDIEDPGGSGLTAITFNMPMISRQAIPLNDKQRSRRSVPFQNIINDNSPLRAGDYEFEAKVVDNNGNETTFRDSFPVSNKNNAGNNSPMGVRSLLDTELTELRNIEEMVNRLENFDKQEMKELERIHILIAATEKSLQHARDHNIEREGRKARDTNWEEIEKDVASAKFLLRTLHEEIGNFEATDEKMEKLKSSFEKAESQIEDELGNLDKGVQQELREHHPAADKVEGNITSHFKDSSAQDLVNFAFRNSSNNPTLPPLDTR